MKKIKIENIKSIRKHLQQWLERYSKSKEAVPYVQMSLELTDWQLNVLSNAPSGSEKILSIDIDEQSKIDAEEIGKILPMIPEYNLNSILDLPAYSTSSSTDCFSFVTEVGKIGTNESQGYAKKYISEYTGIQDAQNRVESVKSLLEKINDKQLIDRFEKAFNAYYAAISKTGDRTAAAAEMRTLLDGVKGFLFDQARQHDNENMDWNEMSSRIHKGSSGGIQHQKLIHQEILKGQLVNELSQILKDREGKTPFNLENIWAQLLDHIFIVFNLTTI